MTDLEPMRDCEGREINWTAFSVVDWLDHGDRAAADHQLAELCDRDLAALLRPLADAYATSLYGSSETPGTEA